MTNLLSYLLANHFYRLFWRLEYQTHTNYGKTTDILVKDHLWIPIIHGSGQILYTDTDILTDNIIVTDTNIMNIRTDI